MKKLIFLIVAAMCSCSAFALSGPYVGVGLGYSNAIFKANATVTTDRNIGGIDIVERHKKPFQGTAGGVQGQLIAGYAYDINRFNLAAELTAQFPQTT